MNLIEFYAACPKKYEFAKRVIARTGVSINTVTNWCRGFVKPSDAHKLKVLSEESGIPVEDLFVVKKQEDKNNQQ